jgi:hypothetical protein
MRAIELAHMLRTGAAPGEAQLTTQLDVPPEAAAEFAMRLTNSRQLVLPLERELLKERISASWIRVTFEKVTVRITPGGSLKPTTDLTVEATGSVDIQVIDASLPFDVAVHPDRDRNRHDPPVGEEVRRDEANKSEGGNDEENGWIHPRSFRSLTSTVSHRHPRATTERTWGRLAAADRLAGERGGEFSLGATTGCGGSSCRGGREWGCCGRPVPPPNSEGSCFG